MIDKAITFEKLQIMQNINYLMFLLSAVEGNRFLKNAAWENEKFLSSQGVMINTWGEFWEGREEGAMSNNAYIQCIF